MIVVRERFLISNYIVTGMFYFTLGNVRTIYRSKLRSINLLAVVKSKLVSEYSMNNVLQPIISDIKKLVRIVYNYLNLLSMETHVLPQSPSPPPQNDIQKITVSKTRTSAPPPPLMLFQYICIIYSIGIWCFFYDFWTFTSVVRYNCWGLWR